MPRSLVLILVMLGLGDVAARAEPTPEAIEFFEKRIRPILADNCYKCHGPEQQKASVRLDSREALLKGGESGPVLVPGKPDESRLLQVMRYDGEIQMPPKNKLPDDAIAAIGEWIKLGAPWPVATSPSDADAWKKHWAFQPPRQHALPKVKNEGWVTSPIDRFTLAVMESKGYARAPQADRRTLVRRLTYDLHGLAPTPDEVDHFVNDADPAAYPKLVDRLLASPRYGERWGRHWLDVARYANERGYVGVGVDRVYPFAYAYRDWVIQAFNEDMPYDQFLLMQLAADQVVPADSGPEQKRHLAAMGFLTVGRRFINNQHDVIDDRIDVTMRGMQGLTVTCARCHDHKYDPIPIRDYYSLYGVFSSSREPEELPLLGMGTDGPQYEAFQKELTKLEEDKAKWVKENEAMKKERPRECVEKIKPFNNRIKQLEAKHSGAPPRGMVLQDRQNPEEPRVLLRGNPGTPGPKVPRQFLGVLAGEQRQPFKKGSGRLELAQAIVSKDNPLTARVLANRVWLHHFGAGLVRTPSDFGLRSDSPSHPELLDFLAGYVMERGWSVKDLHRLILLSNTYQQSSDGTPNAQQQDPANYYLTRMHRQRLDFESLRDSLLQMTGDVDLTMGLQAVDLLKQPFSRRRTIYGFIDRQNLPGTYRVFDFASPDTHSPQRFTTTVPQQALFLMNSPFVIEQAQKIAARGDVQGETSPEGRVQLLHQLLYQRGATAAEVELGTRFVAGVQPERGSKLNGWERYVQALMLSNEFAYVD